MASSIVQEWSGTTLSSKKPGKKCRKFWPQRLTGLVNLDQASKDMPLDFFVSFPLSTGVMGNLGQADYSTANAFMDAYARYRNTLVALKQRQGQTLSINWPLWKEGGMHIDEETEKMLIAKHGYDCHADQTGIKALYQGWPPARTRSWWWKGIPKRLQAVLLGPWLKQKP